MNGLSVRFRSIGLQTPQLGRVGGNIHQIVKHMNYGTGVMHDELRSALSSFEEAAAAIMEAMGRGQR